MGAYLGDRRAYKWNRIGVYKYRGLQTGFYGIDQSLDLRGKKGL